MKIARGGKLFSSLINRIPDRSKQRTEVEISHDINTLKRIQIMYFEMKELTKKAVTL